MSVLRSYLAGPRFFAVREGVRRTLGAAEGIKIRAKRKVARSGEQIPGLVSVVVPAYDVEKYLQETLESLLQQNYRQVEIIVVDDGSPDSVSRITRKMSVFDPRIRLVRQENQGLSGARNTGARHARGEFITFIDSDDTVDRHIFTNAVSSLQTTGSDFAVYPYRRYFKSQYPPAAPWVRDAHEQYRPGVTLAEFPDIMVNAVAWSKLYRRDFWDSNNFEFPKGLLYEDQALSCRAYAIAQSFDVLPVVSINWRIREDQTSISQKLAEPRNIRDHSLAVKQSVEILHEAGLPELAERRLSQVLSFNLGEFVAILGDLSAESWGELVGFLRYLRSAMGEDGWRDHVPSRSKIVVQLILDDEREALTGFLERGGWVNDRLAFSFVDSALIPELDQMLPGYADRAALFARSHEETNLRTSVVRVGKNESRGYRVELDYFVPSLHADSLEYVRFVLLLDDGEVLSDGLDFATGPLGSSTSVIPGNFWETRRAEVWLPTELCDAIPEGRSAQLQMSVEAGTFVRSSIVQGAREKGPLGSFPAGRDEAPLDFMVDPANRQLTISPRTRPSVRVVAGSILDGALVIQAESQNPISQALLMPGGQFILERGIPVRSQSSGDGQLLIEIPESVFLRRPIGRDHYRLLCVDEAGEVAHVRATEPLQTVFDQSSKQRSALSLSYQISPDRLRLRSYREGSEHVLVPAGAALVSGVRRVLIDECEVRKDEIVFRSARHNVGDLDVGDWRFTAEGTGRTIEGTIAEEDGALILRVPLVGNDWAQPGTTVEPRSYTLRLSKDEFPLSVEISQKAILEWVPLLLRREDVNIEVKRSARGYCQIVVRPPLADGDGGPNGYRLKHWYEPSRGGARKKQVLFRSLYGEVANDSALAVFHELRRRETSLELIWSVRDRSVAVPEGASVVIDGTREFYQAYGESQYLMVNVHQADWSQKPEGQTIIQTFHGYPFKLAGRRWWKELGFSAARIDSFYRRALEWDYLVSPAPYATPHLREFLPEDTPFPGEILELGYPRNDLLLSEEAEAVRSRTRERLGIAPDAKVLLYGPTFRDYLSADDMSAKLVDFLDVRELADSLDDDWVVLLRGHPFNARHGVRSNAHVLNVTYYPQINELILASDVGLLDYSSLRFDYALTGKPMLFLTPDRERYFTGRESFEPYELTSPGPHLNNTSEVAAALKNIDKVAQQYSHARARFREAYMPLEDGQAASRLVDAVFVPRGDARP